MSRLVELEACLAFAGIGHLLEAGCWGQRLQPLDQQRHPLLEISERHEGFDLEGQEEVADLLGRLEVAGHVADVAGEARA